MDREERAAWLGHTDQTFRTTDHWYESWDPDYLVNAMQATDAIMTMLNGLTERSLIAPNVVEGGRLTVVKNNNATEEQRLKILRNK